MDRDGIDKESLGDYNFHYGPIKKWIVKLLRGRLGVDWSDLRIIAWKSGKSFKNLQIIFLFYRL